MRPLLGLSCTLLIALSAGTGCRQATLQGATGRPLARRSATPAPAAPASPWVDPAKPLDRQERAVTPAGVELREARFALQAGQPQLVLLLRDYETRAEGKPDLQWIMLLAADGTVRRVQIPASALPAHLLEASSDQVWGVASFPVAPQVEQPVAPGPRELAEKGKAAANAALGKPAVDTEADQHARGYLLKSAGFALWQGTAAAAPPPPAAPAPPGAAVPPPAPGPLTGLVALTLGDSLCPVGFSGDKLLFCRTLTSAGIAGGLVQPKVDWTSQAEYVPLDGSALTLTSDPAFVVNADGAAAAGLAPALTQTAEPAWELHCWTKSRGDTSRVVASLASPAAGYAPWAEPLAWLGTHSVAAFSVLAGATQDPGAANYRLVSVDADNGTQHLLAGHLPATSRVVASGQAVFYAVPLAGQGSGQPWEVWASAEDGLTQRLVYSTPDAVAVTVMDAMDGRVLLNRQYFDDSSGQSELRNQLVEVALVPLAHFRADAAALVSPLGPPSIKLGIKPAQTAKPKAGPNGDFIPDVPGQTGGGGGKYDRKGGGDDLGGGSGHSGGGGSGGPPSLPPLPGS